MADPYLPHKPGSYDPPRNQRDPSSGQPDRTNPGVGNPGSGLGTGLLVALVIVVTAILVAAYFRPGPPAIEATTPAVEAPAVETIPVEPEAGATQIAPSVDSGTVPPEVDTTEPAMPPAGGTASP